MSVQAMAWAIEQQKVTEPMCRFVLVCLGNYADAGGRNAFPSIQRIMRDTGISESSVRRKLRELTEFGMIVEGNQAIVAAHIVRADRRPTVYDLCMHAPRGVTQTPRRSDGVSPGLERGVTGTGTGCQSLTPDPSVNHQLSEREKILAKAKEIRDQFGPAFKDFREIEGGETLSQYRLALDSERCKRIANQMEARKIGAA